MSEERNGQKVSPQTGGRRQVGAFEEGAWNRANTGVLGKKLPTDKRLGV